MFQKVISIKGQGKSLVVSHKVALCITSTSIVQSSYFLYLSIFVQRGDLGPDFFVCCAQLLSRASLLATPWTVTLQAPLSVGFSRQEYWSWLPCPPPGALPNSGIKPRSPASQVDSLLSEPPGKPLFYVLKATQYIDYGYAIVYLKNLHFQYAVVVIFTF